MNNKRSILVVCVIAGALVIVAVTWCLHVRRVQNIRDSIYGFNKRTDLQCTIEWLPSSTGIQPRKATLSGSNAVLFGQQFSSLVQRGEHRVVPGEVYEWPSSYEVRFAVSSRIWTFNFGYDARSSHLAYQIEPRPNLYGTIFLERAATLELESLLAEQLTAHENPPASNETEDSIPQSP